MKTFVFYFWPAFREFAQLCGGPSWKLVAKPEFHITLLWRWENHFIFRGSTWGNGKFSYTMFPIWGWNVRFPISSSSFFSFGHQGWVQMAKDKGVFLTLFHYWMYDRAIDPRISKNFIIYLYENIVGHSITSNWCNGISTPYAIPSQNYHFSANSISLPNSDASHFPLRGVDRLRSSSTMTTGNNKF